MIAKRAVSLRATGAAALLLAVATFLTACSSDSATAVGRGTIAVHLTDAAFPTDSVSRIDVFVVRIDARMADADSATAAKGAPDDSAETGGWSTIATPRQLVNILAYQNGVTLPLGHDTVTVGSYQGFRLVIDPSQSSVTLKNGTVLTHSSSPNVTFPSAARSGLKVQLTQPLEVVANQTTTLLVDFVVPESFVMRGNSIAQHGLLFTPVLRGMKKP